VAGEHIAVDFESYYSPTVSLKKMGVQEYLNHPECEIYLVSAYGDDLNLACSPQDFSWDILHRRTIISHNANFDAQVFDHLKGTGVVPKSIQPDEWNCSANLSAYLGVPRALDGAALQLLDREVSKLARTDMRGKRWRDLNAAQRARLYDYSRQDAQIAWEIWEKNADKWPAIERAFSLLTLKSCQYGIALDIGLLYQQLDSLEKQKTFALSKIPWVQDTPPKPPLSRAAFDIACDAEGLTPPASLAMSSEECDAWMELYGERYPWVGAMRDFRRANMLAAKIIRMIDRLRPNGRMPYELKYFGAHTGRDSGSGKINLQNLPREPICGVDLRSTIIAPPGKKLVIADFRQIEARVLLYMVKDQKQLELISTGMSPYEAHARTSMGWTGTGNFKNESPRHYLLAKARVLALGYGAGWRKFNAMAYLPAYLGKTAAEVFAAPVTQNQIAAFTDYFLKFEKDKPTIKKWHARTPELEREWVNSWLIVQDFREKNSRIVKFWRHLDQMIRSSHRESLKIALPSGRYIQYLDILVNEKDGASAVICKGAKLIRQKLYGGLATENVISAISRDILRDASIRLSEAGYPIILRVHDELVMEVPEDTDLHPIKVLMAKNPAWLPGCPIDISVDESKRYKK
jgi:hypothetical protein